MQTPQVLSTTITLETEKSPKLSAATLIYLQTGLLLLGTLALLSLGTMRDTAAYFFGSGLIEVNLALLIWTFSQIIRKKLVALAVTVIVFKYAFFGAIIYKVLTLASVSHLWFCLGLSTILITVVSYPLAVKLQAKMANNSTSKD